MNIRFYNAKILMLQTDARESGCKKESFACARKHRFDLAEGELWVKGNRIVYIGGGSDTDHTGQKEIVSEIVWDREIDARGNVLMPGFKNAHTHTAMTFLRSYADDLPLQEWLNNQVFPKEAQLTHDDIYHLCKLGIMEYLTSGITSNFDMYFAPLPGAQASVDCGFRTVFTSGLNNFCQSLPEVEAVS